jgi:hypothetical protein
MVNPVLSADGVNPLQIWSARLCKFLSATRKKRLKAGRMCLDKHPAWSVPDILESVNHVSRHEHDASASHLMPMIVVEESYFPFLNQKQFVLVLVIMQWRAAAGRSDLRPQGNSTSGLRVAKMDDNFFAKRKQRVAPAGRDKNG